MQGGALVGDKWLAGQAAGRRVIGSLCHWGADAAMDGGVMAVAVARLTAGVGNGVVALAVAGGRTGRNSGPV